MHNLSVYKASLVCIFFLAMNLYTYHLPINIAGCGYSVVNSAAAAGRIVGGQEVNPRHKLPYQMFLQVTIAAKVNLDDLISKSFTGRNSGLISYLKTVLET